MPPPPLPSSHPASDDATATDKHILVVSLTLVIAAAVGVVVWYFFFRSDDGDGPPQAGKSCGKGSDLKFETCFSGKVSDASSSSATATTSTPRCTTLFPCEWEGMKGETCVDSPSCAAVKNKVPPLVYFPTVGGSKSNLQGCVDGIVHNMRTSKVTFYEGWEKANLCPPP